MHPTVGVALVLAALACQGSGGAPGSRRMHPSATQRASQPKDPAQADAELMGRELLEIMDRVMSYRSSHQGRLPSSLRQAGLDSLAPQFIRRLGRKGSDPLVTIVLRNTAGHVLNSCQGTQTVLEDQALRGGAFDVSCTVIGEGTQYFTVPPREPPPK
jgi:hypothetical protein